MSQLERSKEDATVVGVISTSEKSFGPRKSNDNGDSLASLSFNDLQKPEEPAGPDEGEDGASNPARAGPVETSGRGEMLRKSPSSESRRSFLPDFSGHWMVRDVHNLDPLLAAAGAPWIVRKLLQRSFSKARMMIIQKKNVIYVEDKSIPKDKKNGSMLKFVEGVDSHRKDAYGFKILERCKWYFDTEVKCFVFELETHGYHDGRYGPVVSRYYFDDKEKDVLVSEVRFNKEMMLRHWVRDPAHPLVERTESASLKPSALGEGSHQSSRHSHESSSVSSQKHRRIKVLLYGKGGWMACQIGMALTKLGIDFEFGEARLENQKSVLRDLEEACPTHIINAAGDVGKPTADPRVNLAMFTSNLIGALNLVAVSAERGMHLTHLSELDPGQKATDSFYMWTKQKAEDALEPFKDKVLILKMGIALNADLKHPDSGFGRLRRRACVEGEQIGHSPKYVTCLPELLPYAVQLIKQRWCGTINLVNPGLLSEHRLLVLYKRFVLPDMRWKTVEEEAGGSEGVQFISNPKLEGDLAKMLHAEESLQEYVFAPNIPETDKDAIAASAGMCGLPTCSPFGMFFHMYDSCQAMNHR